MPDNKKKIADDLKQGWNQFTEEVQTTGEKLVDEVKRLVEEGNVRKIRIVTDDGNVLLEIPLTAGVVVGGHAEAVVPLPDNRRIPVMLLGQRPSAGGGSVRNYNTTVVLSDGSRADPQLESRVKAAVLRAMREDRAFRESMVA